jgi:asparagine N-glycosylation enzyme membrane subunit Stt3
LFDLLYFTMPIAALVLVVLGFAADPDRNRSRLYFGILAGLMVILATRTWSPGYL